MANARTRLAPASLLLIAVALLAVGCGKSEPEGTPAACLSDAGAYLEALKAAPGDVRLDGDTPISECFVPEQSGGDLAQMGESMIKAATDLNAEGRRDPTGEAPVQLGYLLGAAEAGVEGIHADLFRRLNVAGHYAPKGVLFTQEFVDGFDKGFDAGLQSG